MKLEWLGEYRDLVEALICFANSYSSVQNKEFIGENTKVSFSQIQVVEYLLENEDDHQKMSEVARRLGITASSFTKLVNKLVDKGVLEKFHKKGNKKDIIIQVTPAGKHLYQKYSEQIGSKLFEEMFQFGKAASEEQLELYTKMLRSLTSKIAWEDKETVVLVAIDK